MDFIKTDNAIPPAAFFAVVRRARARGLTVAAHLPRGVAAWTAADSGVGSIEHIAESVVASPIYAGLAADPPAALRWWRSPAGDSAVRHLALTGRLHQAGVPLLVGSDLAGLEGGPAPHAGPEAEIRLLERAGLSAEAARAAGNAAALTDWFRRR